MSVALKATAGLLRVVGRFERPDDLHARAYPAAAPAPAAVRHRYLITTRVVDDCPVLTLTPRTGATGQQLLYTHGGSYVHPLVTAQWWIIDRISRGTGITITLPLYRLAPEGWVGEAYPLLERVHSALAVRHGAAAVTLAGDSAGAALALGWAIIDRDRGQESPRQLVLLSPWLDIALTNPAAAALEPRDPMLTVAGLVDAGRLWCRDTDPRDPMVSPLHADLSGLPPVHIIQGGHDVLAPDAVLAGERLRQAGNSGSLHLEPGAFHNYLGAFWTSEARVALARTRALLRG